MPTIHYERQGRIAVLTMEGDNDLNLGVVDEALHARLLEYRDDEELWCAIVTGAGDRAFCAGADLKAIAARGSFGRNFWAPRVLDLLSGVEFWKPLIAAVNGHAIGAGMMLALGCDIRVASENATFGLPEVKYGFPPGMGATQRLPRAVALGPAMEMLLTGDRITAQQALQWGLVNRVVPRLQLIECAMELAQRIVANPPLAVRATKELAMRGVDMTLEQGLRLETMLSHLTRPSEDVKEALKAFAEKRPPEFKGR
jgi:enoyl-CoA hydratase/carnithine racemase